MPTFVSQDPATALRAAAVSKRRTVDSRFVPGCGRSRLRPVGQAIRRSLDDPTRRLQRRRVVAARVRGTDVARAAGYRRDARISAACFLPNVLKAAMAGMCLARGLALPSSHL